MPQGRFTNEDTEPAAPPPPNSREGSDSRLTATVRPSSSTIPLESWWLTPDERALIAQSEPVTAGRGRSLPPVPPGPTTPTVTERLVVMPEEAARAPIDLARGFGAGTIGTLATVAGAMTTGAFARSPEEAQRLRAPAARVREFFATSGAETNPFEDPGTLLSPTWWSANMGQLAGTAALMYGAGAVGTATAGAFARWVAPSLVPRLVAFGGTAAESAGEAFLEAASSYDRAIESGADPHTAGETAANVFAGNIAVLGLSKNPLFKEAGRPFTRLLVRAVRGGAEEAAQQELGNVAANRPRGEGVGRAVILGAVSEAVKGGVSDAISGRGASPDSASAVPSVPARVLRPTVADGASDVPLSAATATITPSKTTSSAGRIGPVGDASAPSSQAVGTSESVAVGAAPRFSGGRGLQASTADSGRPGAIGAGPESSAGPQPHLDANPDRPPLSEVAETARATPPPAPPVVLPAEVAATGVSQAPPVLTAAVPQASDVVAPSTPVSAAPGVPPAPAAVGITANDPPLPARDVVVPAAGASTPPVQTPSAADPTPQPTGQFRADDVDAPVVSPPAAQGPATMARSSGRAKVETPAATAERSEVPPPFRRRADDTASRAIDDSPVVQSGTVSRHDAFIMRWLADDLAAGGTAVQEMFKALGVDSSQAEIAYHIDRYLTGQTRAAGKAVTAAARVVPLFDTAWDGQRFDFARVSDAQLEAAEVMRADLRAPVTPPSDTQPRDLRTRFLPERVEPAAAPPASQAQKPGLVVPEETSKSRGGADGAPGPSGASSVPSPAAVQETRRTGVDPASAREDRPDVRTPVRPQQRRRRRRRR